MANDMTRIAQITEKVAKKLDVANSDIDRGRLSQERYVAIYVSKTSGFDAPTIARYFEVSDATVYNAIKTVKERLRNEPLLRVQVNGLLNGKDESISKPLISTNGHEEPNKVDQAVDDEIQRIAREMDGDMNRAKVLREAAQEERFQSAEELCSPPSSDNLLRILTTEAEQADGPLPDSDPNVERVAGPPGESFDELREQDDQRKRLERAKSTIEQAATKSRFERLKERLRAKGILPKETVVQSWDDTPLVKVGEREITIEVEDVGTITIPGHLALGSLKLVAIQRTSKILHALQDGRFRIDGA